MKLLHFSLAKFNIKKVQDKGRWSWTTPFQSQTPAVQALQGFGLGAVKRVLCCIGCCKKYGMAKFSHL